MSEIEALSCLACGHQGATFWATSRDDEYLTTDDEYRYMRCEDCNALFIDPVPSDRLNIIYPSNYYSFDETITKSLIFRVKDWLDQRFFRQFFSGLPQSSLSVLDVGGGAGWQLTTLKGVDSRINRTVVVDLDEAAGHKARELGHEYHCMRFEAFEDERKFDIIPMLNLIEHVDNPLEILRSAHRMLSDDGIVILKTPNTDALDARLFRHHNWGGYHCPRHWVLFQRENFESLVRTAGLDVAHFSYTQGAPFWTASVLFWLARRGLIKTSPSRPVPQHPLYKIFNVNFAAMDIARSKFAKTS